MSRLQQVIANVSQRHGQPYPGHPRLSCVHRTTWMAGIRPFGKLGTGPAMTPIENQTVESKR
jgi:hypothetical protein